MTNLTNELSELCENISHPKLNSIADWSYLVVKSEPLDNYWAERTGFEKGVKACGMTPFSICLNIDSITSLILAFAAKDLDAIKLKIQSIS